LTRERDIEAKGAVLRVQCEIAERIDSRPIVEANEAPVKAFESSKAPLDVVAQTF
jgi:hypothetical protein